MTDRDYAAELTATAERIAREQRITIEWRHPRAMPRGAAAYALTVSRHIVTPIIAGTREASDEAFAICLHECGHVLSEACSGGDHYRDPAVREWWHCIQCETIAWRRAMELARFSRPMFDRLRTSLAFYRRRTPGSRAAVDALDRCRGGLTYREHQQRHVERQIDIKAARLAWLRLSASEQLRHQLAEQDHRIANQKRQREEMRGRR